MKDEGPSDQKGRQGKKSQGDVKTLLMDHASRLAPSTLLLEIGTEELPAADLDSALSQLRGLAPKMLAEVRLGHGAVEVYGTPRRLALLVAEVTPGQADMEELIKGPPANRAYDSGGALTQAGLGFARGKGVPVEALEVREMDGGRYVVAVVKRAGRPAADVLAEALPALIGKLQFERTMRWNETGTAFSRPIRWLVGLLGETVLPFAYAGVNSGASSRGLRPQGSPELLVPHAGAYVETLRAAQIEVEPARRREAILAQVRRLAEALGGRVADEGVLGEVTNLVEQPTAFIGSFDESYLTLPREVLISVMKKHQRYFPVESAREGGALLPNFIAVRNGDEQHLDLVREGNEHVIRARFADAAFFVREDIKRKLEDFLPGLATLTFQKKLGSMLDKVGRIEALTADLAARLGLDGEAAQTARRAARLAKADLATQMVVEMTSLQGLIGREYALRSGENPAVAQAIREHYLPAGAGDALPQSLAGVAVGLADRLDSLAGLFAAGLAPTGSADPFGLRRAALGVTQLLTGLKLDLDLRPALHAALDQLPEGVRPDGDARVKLIGDLLAFLAGRLRGQLLEAGYRYDIVDAVLTEQAHNPHQAAQAVQHLAAWTQKPDWPPTLAAYARCVRITRDQQPAHPVDPAKLAEPAERALYEAAQAASAVNVDSVDAFFAALLPLIPAISRFFEDVLVMADDPAVRANRLGLLQRIAALGRGVADFSKLEGF